jgi:hypothetical protein
MTNKTSLIRLALGTMLTLGMTGAVLAQSTRGSIRGTVLDPSGALVPGSQITVTNASGFSRTTRSSATGSFAVPNLAPGSYSVSINANGFTPALEGGVQVAGDKVTRENIKLGISVAQEIVVSAGEDSDLSTAVDTPDLPVTNQQN